ncbi:MAG: hypothetical protein ABF289_05580 [Clostridiales bacterium]
MIDKYSMILNEYFNIVALLINNENFQSKSNNFMYVEKDILINLFKKHSYLTVNEKLRVWKTLYFLISDKNRYTIKRVVEKDNLKKRTRLIIVNVKTYRLFNKLELNKNQL